MSIGPLGVQTLTRKKRLPLSLTLLPLLLGIGGYFYWWNGQSEEFSDNLRRVLGRNTEIVVGGFPYRMEADFGPMALSRITPLVTLRVAADVIAVNRAPIGRPLTVISAVKPIASVQLADILASRLQIAADSAQSSLRINADGTIARLSTAFTAATIRATALAFPAGADSFEMHVRETPQALDPASRSPSYPEQAQLVLEGVGVRYAGGDKVTLTAQLGIDARGPLRGAAKVLEGGTLEITKLELKDAHGIVATMAATASPDAAGNVMIAGTVDTVCPHNVVALLNGQPGMREMRMRRSQTLAFSGPLGAVAPKTAIRDVPVRNQEPPCPVLRR